MQQSRGNKNGNKRASKRASASSERRTSDNSNTNDDQVALNNNENSNSSSATQVVASKRSTPEFEVEQVVDKKIYRDKVYYKLKWKGWDDPTWELEENCSCENLIKAYEKRVEERSKDEDEDEWEVEEILKRRTKLNETEYLVRWKNWDGEPTWVKEKHCTCVNLIAAFENPKLKKMWNFHGSNTRLWVDRETMLKYMRKYAKNMRYTVNLLKFEPDFPESEEPVEPVEGLNMGPLCYKDHWYLVIILVNYICITKKILICDPLNTLIGVPNARIHPVYKRMTNVYKSYTVSTIAMTPMERSDMCAFYVLAAYERALFCLNRSARFIVNKLFFDHSRPELIRSQTVPESNHEISVNLLNNGSYLDGPKCEFCGRFGETDEVIDRHILDEHFSKGDDPKPRGTSPSKRKQNSICLDPPTKRSSSSNNNRRKSTE